MFTNCYRYIFLLRVPVRIIKELKKLDVFVGQFSLLESEFDPLIPLNPLILIRKTSIFAAFFKIFFFMAASHHQYIVYTILSYYSRHFDDQEQYDINKMSVS